MRKILPILITATVLLTPLYPVYAQNLPARPSNALNAASAPANLKPRLGDAMEDKMDAMGDKVEDRMMALKDKMASRSAALREKLAKFKDKKKAERVENVSTNLNELNAKLTDNLQKVLDKYASILETIKTKTTEAESAGKDVSDINDAIAEVEKQWQEATDAVAAQSAKDYSIVVNSESTAKDDALTARNSLRTDLQSTHTQVVEVRKALSDAIGTALSTVRGNSDGSN